MTTNMPPQPNQLTSDEALAMLPAGDVVNVVQALALPGQPDVKHRWHKDFASDKLRNKGAFRTYDGMYAGFGVYFTDENGDRFFLETQAAGDAK